ncbi:MAG TPA: hypothetical protein VG125_23505 [Pirellulales bacterium]|nr:hypothetical protein [Pirellulales bacterium]
MQPFSWLHKRMTDGPQTRRARAWKPNARFRPLAELLERREVLSTLTVVNNLDSGTGSLRAEIAAAAAGDTIVFAPGLDGQTVTLTSGELDINKSLTINGPGAGQLAVSGGNASRVFEVDGATTIVTLSGLTISHGDSGGGTLYGAGGGILNYGGMLTLSGCTVSQNLATEGGGIYNSSGTLTVSGCMLSGNSALEGGGLYNNAGATATIVNGTLSGNIASGGDYDEGDGGGVYNFEGTVTLSGCTLSGNSAGLDGGAVYTYGYVEVEKSKHKTIDIVIGAMTISGCTVTGSSAFEGAGFYNASATASYQTLTISDSVFSNNGPLNYITYYGPNAGDGDSFS